MQENPPSRAKITVSFSIYGRDFDIDALSEASGRSPTSVWHPNTRFLQRNPTFYDDNPQFPTLGWIYKLVKHPFWSIDDAIREVLVPFRARREQIVAFASKHECSIHIRCQLFGDETVILYEIEATTLADLATFNCSISFTIDSDCLTASDLEKDS
jgi:hypothetical protein